MEMENRPEHRRRIHYAGKYPKKFEEKYKELQPEKYEAIAEHVKAKGNTPAGTHISIMVPEILDFLNIQPGQSGADCTFGYGGHSQKMLERLQGEGHLVSIDVDPIESEKSKKRLRDLGYEEKLHAVELTNFSEIDKVAEKFGPFDFVLADLGVSSMQIDDPKRGFSYKAEGPLDLRMDPTSGVSAARRLTELSEEELIGVFQENADEPYAREIAHTITGLQRKGKKIQTTTELRLAIEQALAGVKMPEADRKEAIKKSCTRCFQALRIDVNSEYEALYALLEKLPSVMNPGGRVAILTFHSGEDRLVKQSFRQYLRDGIYADVSRDVILPSAEECRANPRARSAKLRWAIRA